MMEDVDLPPTPIQKTRSSRRHVYPEGTFASRRRRKVRMCAPARRENVANSHYAGRSFNTWVTCKEAS
ncbi:hypothetical protein Y032_0043g746 [Ancylostoma ceylanicum]|uniref:Uncharacterized protein n=1 Tax=Ancylostoma ceylanicum TaxID=53326 RepID=A0A016UFX1_9BILA|nr:hypothetical protein Y032_0043g746 [Ancylostoma ceylanicum]